MEYVFDDITVALTNLDRVMFAAAGITKREVVAYYKDVAELMVPELRDRALTIERFTKGIEAGGFFQKHAQKHYPPWIRRALLGSKTRVSYPVAETAAAIVYFANQGGLAMHIWTSRTARPEHPDLLVFDLDPPDGRFDLVRRAALELRELFEPLELPAFVKATGSKGLHVVAPLDGAATFDETAALGNRIARLLCERHPDQFTQEFYKKDRQGRLYLDLMRNALGATIIAPYSLRGKPGAPLSAPIEWEEVEDDALRPDGFRLRDLRARLDLIGDPWSNLRARVGSVAKATAALGG
ncbi:MAG: non-homologous end-joining DNA ligase [Myxococcota bacterium]|nr:non-homologous end-joining DNA ligase [Myxococcota bacterium]